MESLGVDAAIADLTNNVSCIFNSEQFIKKYVPNCTASFRIYNQNIRDNTGNLFPAWTKLGSSLRIIPQLGGIDQNVMFPDVDGKTALEKEIDYFGSLMQQYPGREVIYKGKPLMLIFLGAAQDPIRRITSWFQIRRFLKEHPEIENKYTFKMIAGYLDSQSYLWLNQSTPNGPVEVDPEYGFWSWVDRLNTSCTLSLCPYYPSYNLAGSRAENFTASIATAGQNGWGCPNSDAPPYCSDDALRFGSDDSYVTLDAFMIYARQLDPIFLIIHQFNEFVPPTRALTRTPTMTPNPRTSGASAALEAVRQQIRLYHQGARSLRSAASYAAQRLAVGQTGYFWAMLQSSCNCESRQPLRLCYHLHLVFRMFR